MLAYQSPYSASLLRLAESFPRNWFQGSINVYKYVLCSSLVGMVYWRHNKPRQSLCNSLRLHCWTGPPLIRPTAFMSEGEKPLSESNNCLPVYGRQIFQAESVEWMYVFINIAIRKQKEDRGHSDPDLWRPFGELTKHVFQDGGAPRWWWVHVVSRCERVQRLRHLDAWYLYRCLLSYEDRGQDFRSLIRTKPSDRWIKKKKKKNCVRLDILF